MEGKISVLTYAVRGRVVLKYCGQLALMLAILTLAPLAVALLQAEWATALRYALVCGGLLIAGTGMARLPAPDQIQDNEALTITAAAFLFAPLCMSWPLLTAGMPYMDALFEVISGVTTTGLSTLGSIEHRSATFLFARAWMQWYGGLGIVVLSVALLMGHQAAVRRLADPLESGETPLVAAHTHARHSLIIYLGLTALGLILVWALTGDGFNALLHVLAAVSTGGFSSFDASLAGLGTAAAVAVITISFLGAVSLPLYWRMLHAGWGRGVSAFFADIELRALLVGGLLVGGLLSWLAWVHGTDAPWYHGLMMGFSAQTTTGFSSMPVSEMDSASKLLMIISMLVGGSIGSSAGGFKLLRLLVLLRLLQTMMNRLATPPHAVVEPSLAGHKLATEDLLQALQLILLFVGLIALSWLPFLLYGYDPLDALFEVVSASATVGLSTGISRPELETVLKGVLCFDMLAGRLEIIALLVILYPRNWVGRREKIR